MLSRRILSEYWRPPVEASAGESLTDLQTRWSSSEAGTLRSWNCLEAVCMGASNRRFMGILRSSS